MSPPLTSVRVATSLPMTWPVTLAARQDEIFLPIDGQHVLGFSAARRYLPRGLVMTPPLELLMRFLRSSSVMAMAVALLTMVNTHAADELPLVTIPVRIHLVHSDQDISLTTTLIGSDIERIMKKVNAIWAPANIRFAIESVDKTQALAQAGEGVDVVYGVVVAAMPKERILKNGLNIFYVKKLTVNGFYSKGSGLIFVADSARLVEVPGGLDEPIPRVSAHEIGHALGLKHREDETNLMAPGKSGYSLNEAEIALARATAATKFPSPLQELPLPK